MFAAVRMRWGTPARAAALFLLLGSCGFSTGGSTVGFPVVGGVFLPGKLTYKTLDMAGAARSASRLPTQVDLRREGVIPPIQNQRWNNCVGWSLGYYLMTALEMRYTRHNAFFAGNILDPADPENWFSPDYIYSQREANMDEVIEYSPHLAGAAVCVEGDGEIGCMRPEMAIARLMQNGCCRWPFLCASATDNKFRSCGSAGDSLPASRSRAPWNFGEPNGWFFRPRCFVRFGVLQQPGASSRVSPARQMQTWLHEQGTPIAIVVEMREGWVAYRGGNRVDVPVLFRGRNDGLTEERGVCLDAGGASLGGQHMMTIIGYDSDFLRSAANPSGAFLVANQWGAKWGHDGYMWIPVTELERIWIGGYGLIKWIFGSGPAPSGPAVCAPNEFGTFNTVYEADDVARNVVRKPDGCSSNCQLEHVTTAQELKFTGDPLVVSGDEIRVGQTRDGAIDIADWYEITGHEPGQVVECRVTSSLSPRGPIVQLKITDSDLQPLGAFCPKTGVTTAVLGDGQHFLKVEPSYGGAWETAEKTDTENGARYTLTIGPAQQASTSPDCDPVEAVVDLAPLVESSIDVQLADQAWKFYRLGTGLVVQIDQIIPRIQVTGLAPGETVDVVTAGPVAWWHTYFPLKGFRDFELCEVGADGLDLFLDPVEGQPAIDSPNEWDAFVAIRSTSATTVGLTLTISLLPPKGQANEEEASDPGVQNVVRAEIPDWLIPGAATVATRLRVAANEFNWGNWGAEYIELRHASTSPQLRLVDAEGNALGAEVRLEDLSVGDDAALRSPGALRKRLRVPEGWTDDVWIEVYGTDGAPLRNLRLRRSQITTLAVWPMTGDGRFAPLERDDSPSLASPLEQESPVEDSIGFAGGDDGLSWDFYDYYVIENTASTPRAAWLDLTKMATGENIHLYRWSLDDLDRNRELGFIGPLQLGGRFPALCRLEDDCTEAVALQPGDKVLVLVFSGTQALTNYELKVEWVDP